MLRQRSVGLDRCEGWHGESGRRIGVREIAATERAFVMMRELSAQRN